MTATPMMLPQDQNTAKGDVFSDNRRYGKHLVGQPGGIPVQDRQTEVVSHSVAVGMVRCIYCAGRFAITLPSLQETVEDPWPLCCGERVWLVKAWGWVGSPEARHSLATGTQPQEEAV